MGSDANGPALLHFSTRELPADERVPFWREVFGRQVCRVEIEPEPDIPIDTDTTMLVMPGLGLAWCESTTPACWKRTPEHVKDGTDDFALIVTLRGAMTRAQLGQEIATEPGDAVGIIQSEPASIRFRALQHMAMMLPRASLAPLVANVEEAALRPIRHGNEALRLVTAYLASLRHTRDIANPGLCALVANHVCELVAMAIGATRDGQAIALTGGVRAARLKAIKEDLARNPFLSLTALAARQGVSPRYVQMLFEAEGTSFTAFALDLRLERAYKMLTDRRYASWPISTIAYEAGFGDLSHFNRSFKRRYGAPPSDVRVAER